MAAEVDVNNENTIFLAQKIGFQRNCLTFFAALLIISNFVLGWMLLSSNKQVVLIPYEGGAGFAIGKQPDQNYVTALLDSMLNDLLNFSPNTILAKKDRILKHVLHSSSANMEEYYSATAKQFKQLKLYTYFTRTGLDINMEKLSALVHGVLTVKYGNNVFEETQKSYSMVFVLDHARLLLESFDEVKGETN